MNSRANTHPLGHLILKCAYYLVGGLALLLICAAADAGASSGTLQLNLASWISLICFFIGGIAVAIPLFKWWGSYD